MRDTMGIIINNPLHALGALVKNRNPITMPFFARYRLVDFALSNLVNSGIFKIAIVTSDKYRSLLDHVGIGQEWGLSRKSQSLVFMQGSSQFGHSDVQHINMVDFIKNDVVFERNKHKNIIISTSNIVSNISYEKYIDFHNESQADITFLTIPGSEHNTLEKEVMFITDSNNGIKEVKIGCKDVCDRVYSGIMIINHSLLDKFIEVSENTREYEMFRIISDSIDYLNLKYMDITEYYRKIDSIKNYFDANMELIDIEKSNEVFKENNVILTKVKDNHPTLYKEGCDISNACIASGGVIYGKISNSVVFRHAHISENASVSNSILMEDIKIGKNAVLDFVIADRNVTIGDHVILKGTKESPVILDKETVI
ncbi:MAG: glucose-1-phosphate adenylyltransferase subunit GlgD [Clostridia bacterium]|nr:glucose-1-phosphate adenylyltransferase subunit GlgD [Clostridia bacterium]